ncbi:RNA polymerase II-binding domain-containing protein [Myxozyma melibiosi]|uniref:RNA polymerase II-binding domain-containing protein n=1 Tax=Myxozyma melibiosi TaxID=54550 RepID=A0ABR1F1N0_9ASCO
MSYSEDVVASKLSSVNETQEAIVNISQWIMFHRRHAAQTVKTWSKALNDAPTHRKLALIYLANEVIQQSRARKREEFLKAFAPVIADVIENTYRQTNADLQAKIRRVVDVWRQRDIFARSVLDDIQNRLNDADQKKPKAAAGSRRLGQGMTFGMGLAPEISKLSSLHGQVNSRASTFGASFESASKSFSDLVDAEALPAPTEYASRIESVLKALESAKSASAELAKAREEFIGQLQSLVDINKAALEAERKQRDELEEKGKHMLGLKDDIQEMLSGKPSEEANGSSSGSSNSNSTAPASKMSLEELLASTAATAAALDAKISVPDPGYSPIDPSVSTSDSRSATPSAVAEGLNPEIARFLDSLGGKSGGSKSIGADSTAESS